MARATWSPNDTEWLAANPVGLPPELFPYLHAHQRWASTRRQSDRARVDPWNAPLWRVRHPGLSRARRALRWLECTFRPLRRATP